MVAVRTFVDCRGVVEVVVVLVVVVDVAVVVVASSSPVVEEDSMGGSAFGVVSTMPDIVVVLVGAIVAEL